ncbi:bifunctional 2-polyprenyl-6-hydroxyphenol methylase/3-demethylubiquinol 3-O-methyltransferase UbiG [Streptomyces sp. WAC08241]|uniref:class I SAM-dependent methyltransferase n=1 Tax=Streptomyces sp. WAC08241 TaxID=2487421 RepID=UPI000F798D0F|nr:class I SAM-dependent methyltransferase [Streptomyces sp. WAC08241]RSS46009.1 class I SAM-dependent methyltransferase [Streptomyces sp. WAC08241]
MLAQTSPWHTHAAQRTAAGLAEPLSVHARMEWTTRPGQGPGAEILGPDLRGKRLLELGCGPGHNAAHLATRHSARVTGVDLVGLQVRRARSHYGRLNNLTFVAGHALHYLHASDEQFDAIYSVFGAIGLVAPELLLPAIAQRLAPGRVLAFSVPHPQRGGRSPSGDDRPRRDHVTLPDRTQLPIARWEFDTDRWERHLSQAGFWLTSAQEFHDPRTGHWPTTLLIHARKL